MPDHPMAFAAWRERLALVSGSSSISVYEAAHGHATSMVRSSALPLLMKKRQIGAMQAALAEREGAMARMMDEMHYYKLELQNREENYNQLFSKQPRIGVMNPLGKRNSVSEGSGNSRRQSVNLIAPLGNSGLPPLGGGAPPAGPAPAPAGEEVRLSARPTTAGAAMEGAGHAAGNGVNGAPRRSSVTAAAGRIRPGSAIGSGLEVGGLSAGGSAIGGGGGARHWKSSQ